MVYAARDDSGDPPKTFGLGSKGPAMNPLIRFLVKHAELCGNARTGLEADGEYGGACVNWMTWYQKTYGLPQTGYVDEYVLTMMKRHGFDFVADAKTQQPLAVTIFLMPLGHAYREVFWAPGMRPTADKAFAVEQLSALGNDQA